MSTASRFHVGIDVGGTNTDVAVVSKEEVLSWAKAPTSEDIFSGLADALGRALEDGCLDPSQVDLVGLGTTHFVNAALQRRGLARVAVLRLCGPATRSLPPFCDLPPDLRAAVAGYSELLPGAAAAGRLHLVPRLS